jgi:hypothetical protein
MRCTQLPPQYRHREKAAMAPSRAPMYAGTNPRGKPYTNPANVVNVPYPGMRGNAVIATRSVNKSPPLGL